MEPKVKFEPNGKPFTYWLEDYSGKIDEWESLGGENACAFDFLYTSAILEWMSKCNAVKFDDKQGDRFQRYRYFSKFVDPKILIPQLILFEKIYLNIGVYYKSHVDLSKLERYGFFFEYPRPPEERFVEAYNLIRPLALKGISNIFGKFFQVSFDEIWVNNQAKCKFSNYDNLIGWLYNEFTKDACNFESHEMALYSLIKPAYVNKILDFMEYTVHAQGCLASGNLPIFSSVLESTSNISQDIQYKVEPLVREDVFALYQVASRNVLGHSFFLDSFEQLLKLREDKRVFKIRKLLLQYLRAIDGSDQQIVDEITMEIEKAKKSLDIFKFTEAPAYSFIIKPISFVPVLGNVVSVIDGCIDILKAYKQCKHGWIYFGLK